MVIIHVVCVSKMAGSNFNLEGYVKKQPNSKTLYTGYSFVYSVVLGAVCSPLAFCPVARF